jgi:hypothetical protein
MIIEKYAKIVPATVIRAILFLSKKFLNLKY